MTPSRRSYLSLCLAEPFRIFFPFGTLVGISGVSLWPLFFTGMHTSFYPGAMHARLMIEGFLGGFVLGFLGTALPRLLSAPPLRRGELWTLLVLYALAVGLHIGFQAKTGDVVFVVLLLCFAGFMLSRLRRRTELPPPGFVLVGFGLLCGVAGPALWVAGQQGRVPVHAMMFGHLLLNQAFVLFLVLGIGTFLFPRFLRLQGVRTMAEERKASPGWWLRAGFSAATALVLLASYWIEAGDLLARSATWLRTGAAVVYLAAMVPFHRQTFPLRTAPLSAQLSLMALAAGLIFPLLWPAQRIAGLHIVFLGGFSLITFTVATRVVLGHSGHESLFETRLGSLQFTAAMMLVGAVLRAVGDFSPLRPHWLNGASYLWMLGALVWGFAILPKVRIPDPDDDPRCAGSRRAAAAGS